MLELENDFLKIHIKNRGAELVSIYSKRHQLEYLWQGNPAYWPWHAPNLFPVVGACYKKRIQVDGKLYGPMQRHGFARHAEFSCLESKPLHVKLALHDSPDTQTIYPYKFEFQVLYGLAENQLRVSYKVINRDDKAIYFSLGGHPAFNIPLDAQEKFEDYFLEFEQCESLQQYFLSQEGLLIEKPKRLALDGNKLALSRNLFNNDALIFKNLASNKVILCSKGGKPHLYVSFPHFHYLGIWSKENAPFICIEPWVGCPDTANKQVDFKHKEGIQKLAYGHVFEADFVIGIL